MGSARILHSSFIPIQPEIKLNSDNYIEKKERDIINHTTILFYQFTIKENLITPISVIPDGCIDIVFCCCDVNPHATVHGSRLRRKPLVFKGGYEYFGIRFIPNQDASIFKYSMKEITDQDVSLIDLFKIDPNTVEMLINEKDFNKRINLYKELIGYKLLSDCSSQRVIRYALNKIYTSRGDIKIDRLAEEIGYSSRYLRKQFEERVGLSPKLFSQITRYQYSLFMLLNNDSLWDVIKQGGYYDQAHIINEFKKFGNLTPNELVKSI